MKAKKMKMALVLAFATAGVLTSNGYAQVTIGSESAPHPGALLDLRTQAPDANNVTATKGLLLPRVELTAYDVLTVADVSEKASATGMIVWNTNATALNGVGTYQWDGTQWQEMKAAGIPKIDYGVIPFGISSGTIYGKTCFDIAKTFTNPECGTSDIRTPLKADFSGAEAATRQYIYTFTPVAGCSDLTWVVVDWATKSLVESVSSSNVSGDLNAGQPYTYTVTFRQGLNDDPALIELDRAHAAKVMVYAIFNNGQGQVQLGLALTVQDCACCGAFVAASTWKEFLCYNLGADQTKDPFTPSRDINGSYFQWGKKEAWLTQSETDDLYSGSVPTNSGYYGSGSQYNYSDITKSPTDPCPPGYRVPSYNEWEYLRQQNAKTNNPLSWDTSTSSPTTFAGSNFGAALFLPAAGKHDAGNGTLGARGGTAYYWATYAGGASRASAMNFWSNPTTDTDDDANRQYGYSVRCIAIAQP